MTEIYWILRLGVIGDICGVIAVVGIALFCLGLLFTPLIIDMIEDMDSKDIIKRFFAKVLKVCLVVWIVGIIGCLFIPTKKEMYAIYGVGGTIDYIKSNNKAKQLPDKCINALTRYVDNIENENKKDNND